MAAIDRFSSQYVHLRPDVSEKSKVCDTIIEAHDLLLDFRASLLGQPYEDVCDRIKSIDATIASLKEIEGQ